mmetsp:Transcript_1149/g.1822  ORF Transcript_1149/g.1822 Transcript_1149/m.1822 type:complete len:87 (+) Transcript_1149:289-549(+)
MAFQSLPILADKTNIAEFRAFQHRREHSTQCIGSYCPIHSSAILPNHVILAGARLVRVPTLLHDLHRSPQDQTPITYAMKTTFGKF